MSRISEISCRAPVWAIRRFGGLSASGDKSTSICIYIIFVWHNNGTVPACAQSSSSGFDAMKNEEVLRAAIVITHDTPQKNVYPPMFRHHIWSSLLCGVGHSIFGSDYYVPCNSIEGNKCINVQTDLMFRIRVILGNLQHLPLEAARAGAGGDIPRVTTHDDLRHGRNITLLRGHSTVDPKTIYPPMFRHHVWFSLLCGVGHQPIYPS